MDVQLNFINQSNDTNNSEIVVFQKNVKTGYSENEVAWRVIRNCGHGESHPFLFPETIQVASGDSYGNYTSKLNARPGDAFSHSLSGSGDVLAPSGRAGYPAEVQVTNALQQGSISANIYKDGKLLASKTSVAPQQMAAFQFQPTIWIGTAPGAVEGQVMDSAMVDAVNTEISLLGLASADIVMTGGGSGGGATPLTFTLQNPVWA